MTEPTPAESQAVDVITKAAGVAKEVVSSAATTAATMLKEAKTSNSEGLAVIQNDLSYIKRDIGEIKQKLDHDYVSKDEFNPVRNVVYGLVGILGVATVGAILKLVFIP